MNNEDGWQSAIAVFSDRERFPNIPANLIKHVELCFRRGHDNRLTEKLARRPEFFAERIDFMFGEASEITDLSADELLRRTDFHPRDTDPNRVEAAFAEIRTIRFLDLEEFTDIQPLRAQENTTADIIARRNGVKYAVEVALSIFQATERFASEGLSQWLTGRYISDEKSEQLKATADAYDCERRVLIAIVDTQAPRIFQVHDDFCEAAKHAWRTAGEDSRLHIGFVTGQVEVLEYGRDDCVFPEWPDGQS